MSRIYTEHWKDYELIDAGNERKLERWGSLVTIRPERNAYFPPILSEKEWIAMAHFSFKEISSSKGEWECLKPGTPDSWQMNYNNLVFNLKLTQFKHVGLFPEQRTNWDYISENIQPNQLFLNLFGYTGGASLAARDKGALVYHCYSIKQINGWAKENMESSKLSDIRWVHEDALKFAQREVKRGNRYQGIIMDPPAFCLGANKQRWKIEDMFAELMENAKDLIEVDGFLIANTYSPRLQEKQIKSISKSIFTRKIVDVETLSMKTTTGKLIYYVILTRIK